MTCRSCGFENMRNAAVCARCGAKLVWEGRIDKKAFAPPRRTLGSDVRLVGTRFAGRLPSLWRRLPTLLLFVAGKFVSIFTAMPRRSRFFALAAIVPGLGQALRRRWLLGLFYMALWGTVLALAVHVGYSEPLVVRERILTAPGHLTIVRGYSLLQMAIVCFAPFVLTFLHWRSALDAMGPAEFCRTENDQRIFSWLILACCFVLYGIAWCLLFL